MARGSSARSGVSRASSASGGSVSNLTSSRGTNLGDLRELTRPARPGTASMFSPVPECGAATSGWDTSGMGSCPASARDGCGGRPTTRDSSSRPCTQDGARRPGTKDARRHGHEHSRPVTRDAFGRDDMLRPPQTPLGGLRPCTREDARLQQMITGSSHRHSARGERGDAGRDAGRPAMGSGASERRCQDPSTRHAASSREKRNRHGADLLGLDAAIGALSQDASLSPLPTSRTLDSHCGDDDVVDLT